MARPILTKALQFGPRRHVDLTRLYYDIDATENVELGAQKQPPSTQPKKKFIPQITKYEAGAGTVTVVGNEGKRIPIWEQLHNKGMHQKEKRVTEASPSSFHEITAKWQVLRQGDSPFHKKPSRGRTPPPRPRSGVSSSTVNESLSTQLDQNGSEPSKISPRRPAHTVIDPWRRRAVEMETKEHSKPRANSAPKVPRCAGIMTGTARETQEKNKVVLTPRPTSTQLKMEGKKTKTNEDSQAKPSQNAPPNRVGSAPPRKAPAKSLRTPHKAKAPEQKTNGQAKTPSSPSKDEQQKVESPKTPTVNEKEVK